MYFVCGNLLVLLMSITIYKIKAYKQFVSFLLTVMLNIIFLNPNVKIKIEFNEMCN